MEEKQLSKKEKSKLRRQQELERIQKEQQKKKFMKWGAIGGIVALVAAGFVWVIIESSKPLPGIAIPNLGRGHIPTTQTETYNSNPPTSGTIKNGQKQGDTRSRFLMVILSIPSNMDTSS